MRLSGKTALVTGGSQGIGEAVAIRLAQEGADVVVNYHSHPEGADKVASEIKKLGRRCICIGSDLAKVEDAGKLIQESVAGLGGLDILVNNAGMEKRADFWNVAK